MRAAPHPAESTTTGASPGIDAMTRRASARAPSVRPAWPCSAPQQSPPRPGRATPAPVASITRWAAAWVGRIHASITQPVKSQTSVPLATSGRRRSGSRGRPSRGRTRPHRWATASPVLAAEQEAVVTEHAVARPPPPRLVRRASVSRAPFHQPAERHRRRAGHLAAPALHAQVHERGERRVLPRRRRRARPAWRRCGRAATPTPGR